VHYVFRESACCQPQCLSCHLQYTVFSLTALTLTSYIHVSTTCRSASRIHVVACLLNVGLRFHGDSGESNRGSNVKIILVPNPGSRLWIDAPPVRPQFLDTSRLEITLNANVFLLTNMEPLTYWSTCYQPS